MNKENFFLKLITCKAVLVYLCVVLISGCSSPQVMPIVSSGAYGEKITTRNPKDSKDVQSQKDNKNLKGQVNPVKQPQVKTRDVAKSNVLSDNTAVNKSTIDNLKNTTDEIPIKQEIVEKTVPEGHEPKKLETSIVKKAVLSHKKAHRIATNVHLKLKGTAVKIKEAVGVALYLKGDFDMGEQVLSDDSSVESGGLLWKDATGIKLNLMGNAVSIKEALDVRLNLEGNAVQD